ncbi:MAG: hypothetical protein ACOCSD_02335 [Halolamina sp.]
MGGPTRRQLLATVATTTGLAGCTAAERARLNPVAEPPVSMTVIRASSDESETRCRLDADAVGEIPELQNPLDELNDAEAGDRIHRGLSIQSGRQISNTFSSQCDEGVGGLYRYEDAWYLVGLTYRDQEAHQEHHEHLAESETASGNESSDDGDAATATATRNDTETSTPN